MDVQSRRVLVADDEEMIRLTMELLLRKRGYAVTTATDGTTALALIEQQPFDLLILDLKMPGLNGLQVAQHARVLQPAAAVVLLTGSSPVDAGDASDEAEALNQFDYLLKTTSPQAVMDHIADVMQTR